MSQQRRVEILAKRKSSSRFRQFAQISAEMDVPFVTAPTISASRLPSPGLRRTQIAVLLLAPFPRLVPHLLTHASRLCASEVCRSAAMPTTCPDVKLRLPTRASRTFIARTSRLTALRSTTSARTLAARLVLAMCRRPSIPA